jgi:hypothetical protein
LKCSVVFISSVNHRTSSTITETGMLKLDQALCVAEDGLVLNFFVVCAGLFGGLSFVIVDTLEFYDGYDASAQVPFDLRKFLAT